ncbi:ComEA family DNA-binding protein [Pseudomonas sp. B21-023]|uniref:ComEA family DNA-binding protein n=1 Tax=unclassified Pseudomonas TaxID=196821 RepID=UPI00215EA507|nr:MULTISPECIES: ComEA family DNA-binding protein [unclassified Pseudomonas]UVL17967.1 ComEA family DNA-binding protein [Pseudomonas sp. B21-044]UVM15331.1 ComEA family DNA-binding protein [Pseudomonas sp. B21-023]
MRNTVLSYLLLPFFAALPFNINAASSVDGQPVAAVVSPQGEGNRIDLNKADSQTLQKALDGIGQAKAQAIIAYREANGPFTSVDELLEIKGIGSALLERNRDRLTVE